MYLHFTVVPLTISVRGGRICVVLWPLASGYAANIHGNHLAHELGHVLNLRDFEPGRIAPSDVDAQLAAAENLMSSSSALGTRLTQDQIQQAHRSPWLG